MSYFEFFFFNDTATTEIYTLSLHDALPISAEAAPVVPVVVLLVELDVADVIKDAADVEHVRERVLEDRKSTRLNSSHANISYAVFCLKKKKNHTNYF